MANTGKPQFERVDAATLRRKFNDLRCWERLQNGELVAFVGADRPAPVSWLPEGSRSQSVTYYDKNLKKVAIVHQYLRPDGSLGASGMPDPKLVVDEDTVYMLKRD